MPPRAAQRVSPVPAESPAPKPSPAWLRAVLIGLAALVYLTYCSIEVGDNDTWWHLKTGQYLLETHKLPVPDPFAYTTYFRPPTYAREALTGYFNLTHEWLAQVVLYAAYAAGGFRGLIFLRVLFLTAFGGFAGLVVWRRTRSFHRALIAGLCVIGATFQSDRPQYFTFAFLTATMAILEYRKVWLLPPLFLIWANCHGGFLLGWVVVGLYCAEALYQRFRGRPAADERALWMAAMAAILVSGINPNGFNIVPVMIDYRKSPMQARIQEWQYPKFWELTPFTVFLYGTIAVLWMARRKTRAVDWLLLAVFGAASLSAVRNIILIGAVGAVLMGTYLPRWTPARNGAAWALIGCLALASAIAGRTLYPLPILLLLGALLIVLWTRPPSLLLDGALAAVLAAASLAAILDGRALQFRPAAWKEPAGAADFLLAHRVTGRMFNLYEDGGYLIWRLWPQEKVFVDGRALNETVFQDAQRIAYNADSTGGKSGMELLDEYGIQIIVITGFNINSGQPYLLMAALSDPKQATWKLVYRDGQSVVFMRQPPPGVTPLNSFDALAAMEDQCSVLMEHDSKGCAPSLRDLFARIGDAPRAAKWNAIALSVRQ